MQRWKLTIEYDGTEFCGWQKQENAHSIQQAMEEAIYKFCGENVNLFVAGRTDAGVHATGQVAHADIERISTATEVRKAINYHLHPHKIAVVAAEEAGEDFHARFSAKKRVYCYKILCDRKSSPVVGGNYVWHVPLDLDAKAMHEAAQYLLGKHDFSSFRAAACQANSPIRTMDRVDVFEVEDKIISGKIIEIWAEAQSFLHHQIRNIAGTLKMVGEGKITPSDVKEILEAKDRAKAGAMAPASGLCFVRVDY